MSPVNSIWYTLVLIGEMILYNVILLVKISRHFKSIYNYDNYSLNNCHKLC